MFTFKKIHPQAVKCSSHNVKGSREDSSRNLLCRILQTEKLYIKCCKYGERVHSFHQILTNFLLKAVNNKHSGDIFQILYSFMTQWKRKIGFESLMGVTKYVVWHDDPERQLIWPSCTPGLQEAPPMSPQGTAKHPCSCREQLGSWNLLVTVNSHCSVEPGPGFYSENLESSLLE